MRDAMGSELAQGDEVAYAAWYFHNPRLRVGLVRKLMRDKQVLVLGHGKRGRLLTRAACDVVLIKREEEQHE